MVLTVEECIPINSTWFQRHFYRRKGKSAYIVGEAFKITYKIQNIGDAPFPEGKTLNIEIIWSNQQRESTPYPIKPLHPGEEQKLGPSNWDVLSSGFALFYVGLIESSSSYINRAGGAYQSSHKYYPLFRDEENQILPSVAFHSIFAQKYDAFYQYWAMILALFALWIPSITSLIDYYRLGYSFEIAITVIGLIILFIFLIIRNFDITR